MTSIPELGLDLSIFVAASQRRDQDLIPYYLLMRDSDSTNDEPTPPLTGEVNLLIDQHLAHLAQVMDDQMILGYQLGMMSILIEEPRTTKTQFGRNSNYPPENPGVYHTLNKPDTDLRDRRHTLWFYPGGDWELLDPSGQAINSGFTLPHIVHGLAEEVFSILKTQYGLE